MTFPTPEWCETEVLLTVCIAVEVDCLGRVAIAHQIAPWSEDLTCLSHHAVGAAFRSTSVWTVSNFLDAVARAVRCQSHARTHHTVASAQLFAVFAGAKPFARKGTHKFARVATWRQA